jgi:hypothetical protein
MTKNIYQELKGQHLLSHSLDGGVALHLKLFMVDQVHHSLEGVALQIPSKSSRLPSDPPMVQLAPSGYISAELSDSKASGARGLFDLVAMSTPAEVRL